MDRWKLSSYPTANGFGILSNESGCAIKYAPNRVYICIPKDLWIALPGGRRAPLSDRSLLWWELCFKVELSSFVMQSKSETLQIPFLCRSWNGGSLGRLLYTVYNETWLTSAFQSYGLRVLSVGVYLDKVCTAFVFLRSLFLSIFFVLIASGLPYLCNFKLQPVYR